ncbi:MAG: hypothetical protein V4666_02365 [Bacteroidota bacterium]
MKLSLRLLLLLPFILIMVGCPSDDEPTSIESRPYAEVYAEDIVEIENFMDEHFMTVDGDNNVTFTKITSSTPGTPISAHPDLTFKTITKGGVDHKLYFIKLQEGLGDTDTDLDTENDNPTRLDSIFTSYKGFKTDLSNFDEASSPIWLELEDVIQGWQEIFPEFKIGNSTTDITTNITTFSGFGAGVMFVPSALAYYSQSAGSIPGYSPIIFSFKLMKLRFKDHDGDKVLSKYEYGGPISSNALDSDGDGKVDYVDNDDDNDGKRTIEEVRITPGTSSWHTYDNIPTCVGGGNGKKKHLDPFCQ